MIESGSLFLNNTYTHHTSAPVLPAPAVLYRSRRLCVVSLSFLFIFSSSVIFCICAAHLSLLGAPVMAAGHWDDVNEETSAADTHGAKHQKVGRISYSPLSVYMCSVDIRNNSIPTI